ncbi:MAG: histidine phosphatase family protein [Bdellovibrionaceae bacterium]|nr:histidine phosphatase family protein [Pseudobdellovibrionaceae bacterium]NUM58946.1 histidine phosphatase family protein [Pseudobdellovibrionaceae bacterium]
MFLYLIRHAIAEEREIFAKKKLEDSLRPLTIKGEKKLSKIIIKIKKDLSDVDLIVTSPFLRTKQSAKIISDLLGKKKVIESAELVPHATPEAFIPWLKSHGKSLKKIVVVGHEPHLSSLGSYILTGKTESFLELKKSSIALIETGSFEEITPSKASLLWLLSPKLIDKIE